MNSAVALMLSIAACGSVLAGAPAWANPKSTGDTYNSRGKRAVSDGAIELKRLSNCAAKRTPGYVSNFLNTRPSSSEEYRILHQLLKVMENCLTNINPVLNVQTTQTRGALAEEMYLAEYPVDLPVLSGPHEIAPLNQTWAKGDLEEYEKIALLQQDFARCVVAANASDSAALLRTELRSAQEKAAIRSIQPHLGPCLQNGVNMHLDAAMLRALLAEGLYHSVRAWKSAPPIAEAGK